MCQKRTTRFEAVLGNNSRPVAVACGVSHVMFRWPVLAFCQTTLALAGLDRLHNVRSPGVFRHDTEFVPRSLTEIERRPSARASDQGLRTLGGFLFKRCSMAARRGSSHGGRLNSTLASPGVGSLANPGPSVARAKLIPQGARK